MIDKDKALEFVEKKIKDMVVIDSPEALLYTRAVVLAVGEAWKELPNPYKPVRTAYHYTMFRNVIPKVEAFDYLYCENPPWIDDIGIDFEYLRTLLINYGILYPVEELIATVQKNKRIYQKVYVEAYPPKTTLHAKKRQLLE